MHQQFADAVIVMVHSSDPAAGCKMVNSSGDGHMLVCREAAAKINVNRDAVLRDITRNSGVVPGAAGSNGAPYTPHCVTQVLLSTLQDELAVCFSRVANSLLWDAHAVLGAFLTMRKQLYVCC